MRAILLATAMALAACAEDPESAFPDPSPLYQISGSDLRCDGGTVWYTEPEAPPYVVVGCAWECLTLEGRAVRRVEATFHRESDGAPWRHTFTNWTFGSCG